MSATRIFTCSVCGYTGPSEWSEEEAEAECLELWGEIPMGDERKVVCDECFKKALVLLPHEES